MPKLTKLEQEYSKSLATLRRAKGLSYRDLAEQTGLAGPYIYQIEVGLRHPSMRVMEKLAKVLQTTVPVMLDPDGYEP